jgi:hypothetical protein
MATPIESSQKVLDSSGVKFDIQSSLTGDAEIKRYFLNAGSTLRAEIRKEVERLGLELRGRVQGFAPRLSGLLQSRIRLKTKERDNEFKATVWPAFRKNADYGVALEGGVDKVVTVEAYRRRVRSSDVRAAVFNPVTGKWRGKKAGVIVRKGVGEVSTYKRHMRLPAFHYMDRAFSGFREEIPAAIDAAIERAMRRA